MFKITFKNFYKIFVCPISTITSGMGFVIATVNEMDYKINNPPIIRYTNVVGFTTLGLITGLTFPVSLPTISIYTLYNIYKQNETKTR
jgi:hypothetical protein